ncbi:fimbria/pilus outer membrane usher protein [Pseudocitrobacter cyperus]|uniref:Fimbria/pilus outer membrane usher protein n=1 Tax=Pseudocitrobacter cyperus TaxID=3112843 RepID=A0ABV0HJI3_9ENTR
MNDNALHEGIDLYLDVTVNGNPKGLVHFRYTDSKLFASPATLHQLGIPRNQESALNDIPQLNVDYDIQQQTLTLTAPLSALALDTTKLGREDAEHPQASVSRGLLLNYDIYAAQGDKAWLNTWSELRAFNSAGVLSSTQLSQNSTDNREGYQSNGFTRLDTSWRSSFPDKMLYLSLGDTLTSALPWSRSTRIAGLQIGTDFSLQPYQPTTPLPAFFGSATLPSSVELYVNGVRNYNGNVPAGNFEINTLPNINGAGNAQVMMTDALGRTTVQNFSFYNDQSLLRKGLTEWSVELGVVRENYGYTSFDYASKPALSATWRHGVSNTFTSAAHGEASDSLINGGLSNDWVPGSRSGTLSAALAFSNEEGNSGALYSLGYRWSNDIFSFNTSTTVTHGDYRDIATGYGQPPPELNSNTVVGYNAQSFGNFSVGYLQFRYPHDSNLRYVNANWSKALTEKAWLNLGLNQNLDDHQDSSVYLMLTLSLESNRTVSSTVQRTNNETGYMMNASQMLPSEGGWGWNIAASHLASETSGQGEIGYQGRYGKVYSGFNRVPDDHYAYAGATGSLVMMGGGLFAAREINNGFAVVSTNGVPNVPISLENNVVGTSGDDGLLLVTQLNSYQNNMIGIDTLNLPANTRVDRVNAAAVPADRSGTLVEFNITATHPALIVLVDPQGHALPEGSQATLNPNQKRHDTVMVGFDGMAYFETVSPHNTLEVSHPGGTCAVQFDYPRQAEGIPQIGPLVCR